MDTSVAGAIRLTLNQAAELVDVEYGGSYQRRNEKDTLVLFYRLPGRRYALPGAQREPGRYRVHHRPGGWAGQAVSRTGGPTGKGIRWQRLRLEFNRPLEAVDTSLVRLLRDTLPAPVPYTYTVDSADAGVLTLRAGFATGSRYVATLLPGALTDWTGATNRDTIARSFSVDDPEKYGTLTLTFVNLDPTANYILRLVKGEEVLVATRRYIEKRFDYVANYTGLNAGTYLVELLYDSNENNRYDSGDLLFGLQPEIVRRFTLEALRANWEVEQTIDLDSE